MAAATAAAATSATARLRRERFGAAAGSGRTENRELDGGFLAGALRAGDFLLLVDHDFFKFRLAVVADVFVDGHGADLGGPHIQIVTKSQLERSGALRRPAGKQSLPASGT
jgi:hypothetical protein